MAEKFVKASVDDTVKHGSRQLFARKFDIGSAWTKLRIAAAISLTDASGNDVTPTAENLANSAAADRFAFGIANYAASVSGLLPGQSGQVFVGMNNSGANSFEYRSANNDCLFGGSTFNDAGATIDTTRNITTSNSNATAIGWPTAAQMSGSSTWCRYFGFDIELIDRGLSTQQIKIYMLSTQPAAVGHYTIASFRAAMSAAAVKATAFCTQNLHVGGTPAAVPDALFIYGPFLTNLLRVHAYGVKKIA